MKIKILSVMIKYNLASILKYQNFASIETMVQHFCGVRVR